MNYFTIILSFAFSFHTILLKCDHMSCANLKVDSYLFTFFHLCKLHRNNFINPFAAAFIPALKVLLPAYFLIE
jgi:hypothetical protein